MNFSARLSVESGLSNSNVIGNNVANANVTGFKHWQVQFADMVANSLSGSGRKIKMTAALHQFNQRNITPICLPSLFPRVKRPLLRSAS